MKNSYEKSGIPSSAAELRVCKSVAFILLAGIYSQSSFFCKSDPLSQNQENHSVITRTNSGMLSYQAEYTVQKFGVKYV